MKAHLKDSDSPIVEGNKIVANCLTLIPNARIVMMWDATEMGQSFEMPTRNICKFCHALEITGRYVYGIVSGQEALNQGEAING